MSRDLPCGSRPQLIDYGPRPRPAFRAWPRYRPMTPADRAAGAVLLGAFSGWAIVPGVELLREAWTLAPGYGGRTQDLHDGWALVALGGTCLYAAVRLLTDRRRRPGNV